MAPWMARKCTVELTFDNSNSTIFSANRIGPLFLGVILSAILYGLCLLQAFLYFQSTHQSYQVDRFYDLSPEYKQDLWYIKATVKKLDDISIYPSPHDASIGDSPYRT